MAKEVATLGGGCFWCLEAVYRETEGVEEVVSGYAGGAIENPTYKQICTGGTGHAEVVQLTFDNDVITYREILEIFFTIHDPTTLDRQGNDVGTQYRSVIYTNSESQQQTAQEMVAELADAFDAPIVTKIEPTPVFYPAEDYHQQYFENNPNQPYCAYVVAPKVMKFRKKFAERRKA